VFSRWQYAFTPKSSELRKKVKSDYFRRSHFLTRFSNSVGRTILIESRQNRMTSNAFRHISAMAESPSGMGTGGTAAAGAATTALQIVGDPAGRAGPAPPAKPKMARADSLTAPLQVAMPRAFVGLWMLDRDAARKDYAELARAASRRAEDANPLEVTEVQAEQWVARAVGSGKQLMLKKRDKDAAWEEALPVTYLSSVQPYGGYRVLQNP